MKPKDTLTPREIEIAQRVADGLRNSEIAQQLSVSESYVRNTLVRVFDKVGVSTRVELALFIVVHGAPPKVVRPAAGRQSRLTSGNV